MEISPRPKSCLGIDPSMNATGYCIYYADGRESTEDPLMTTMPPKPDKVWTFYPQTMRLMMQRDTLNDVIEKFNPDYISIEQPYVLPMAVRGSGGHQSSNMWAAFVLMLDAARAYKKPIAIFHISQLRSAIHGRGATAKSDTIARCKAEIGDLRDPNEHEADAYFIAKYGLAFWFLFDYAKIQQTQISKLTDEEILRLDRIFTGEKGMLARPGDAWLNFREHHVVYATPPKWLTQR